MVRRTRGKAVVITQAPLHFKWRMQGLMQHLGRSAKFALFGVQARSISRLCKWRQLTENVPRTLLVWVLFQKSVTVSCTCTEDAPLLRSS